MWSWARNAIGAIVIGTISAALSKAVLQKRDMVCSVLLCSDQGNRRANRFVDGRGAVFERSIAWTAAGCGNAGRRECTSCTRRCETCCHATGLQADGRHGEPCVSNYRTSDVVESAVSPQVGQAVLPSLDPIRTAGLIQRGRAGGTACPTCQPLAIERNGSAHFPRQAEIAGRHQEL